jgi:hypothetical protein
MKPGFSTFRHMVVVLDVILGLSARKVRSLAVRLVFVLAAGHLLGITIYPGHKIETTMLTLVAMFVIAIAANGVATHVSYRDGIRMGRLENGWRAYRLWRRIQGGRALPA